MRRPVAMPISRSAAVRRGLAASARASALRKVRVCACNDPMSQGLMSNAVAHAMRAATFLENIEKPEERGPVGAVCARRLRSGQVLGRRRLGIGSQTDAIGRERPIRSGRELKVCDGQNGLRYCHREAAVTMVLRNTFLL